MDFLELAKKRYSVRSYEDRPVEAEKLERILQAAQAAPTAANLQPVRLIVVRDEEGLARIGRAASIYGAPLAVIVCADRERAWERPYDGKRTGDIDAAILTDHMMLEAAALGLGSLWVCYFKPDVIREAFHLPDRLEPVNILAIGYAAGEAADPERHARTRIPVAELTDWER